MGKKSKTRAERRGNNVCGTQHVGAVDMQREGGRLEKQLGDRVEDLLLNMWMEVRTWACRADRTSCSQDGIPENEGAKEQ